MPRSTVKRVYHVFPFVNILMLRSPQVSSIQDELHALKQLVAHISNLRAQMLEGAEDSRTDKQNEASLDESVEEARGIAQRIKGALWELQKQQQPPGNRVRLLRLAPLRMECK